MDYSFQNKLKRDVLKELTAKGVCCLGAAPSSGKTEMSIDLMSTLLKKKMVKNALVLSHGQTVLKHQFIERLKTKKFRYSYGYVGSNKKVHIALPQSRRHIQERYDLLVVDEAHEFYHAKMVQEIIERVKPKYVLCMTGTPFIFNRTGEMRVVDFAPDKLLDHGVITDPKIKIVQCSQAITIKSLDKNDEATKASLLDVVPNIDKLNVYKLCKKIPGKVMVVAPSIEYSKQFYLYLVKKGVSVTESNFRVDRNNENINQFKTNKKKVVIVVRRGILGYSMNNLNGIIDYSFSHNVNGQFQLLNRVTRPGGENKYFYKVTTEEMMGMTYSMMNVVLNLINTDVFREYKGRYKDIEIPIYEGLNEILVDPEISRAGKNIREFDFDLDYFIKAKEDCKLIHLTTMRRVRKLYLGFTGISLSQAIEVAKKYKTRTGFARSKDRLFYNWCQRNGVIDKVCHHMPRYAGEWTEEKLVKLIKKEGYKDSAEFKKRHRGALIWIKEKGLGNKFSKLIKIRTSRNNSYWTKERLKKEALKYNSKAEWSKANAGYAAAFGKLTKKEMDEITAHMINPRRKYTPEKMKELCKEFKTTGEVKKANKSLYNALIGYPEVRAEIFPDRKEPKKWTRKQVEALTKDCYIASELLKKSSGAYSHAYQGGYLKDLFKDKKMPKSVVLKKCRELNSIGQSRSHLYQRHKALYISAEHYGVLDKYFPYSPASIPKAKG